MVMVIPKFSAPHSGQTIRQTRNSFRGARTCSRSSITKFGGARISPAARGDQKRWVFFVFQSAC